MDISIIIPVYNEENSISEVLTRVEEINFKGMSREIIVVDDGSNDGTPEILKHNSMNPGVKIFTHSKNLGKGMALRTGLKWSEGSIIAFQDSDMEYDPKFLPLLIKPIIGGECVVYGSRFLGSVKQMTFVFYFGNKILSFLTRILYGAKISDMETGFKIFRREVIEDLKLESIGFEIEPELTAKILKKGYRIKEIPIDYVAREKEQKKITVKDGLIALFTLLKYRLK
jgi:glycosyltransferase involved in cell wall biosynthesis